MCITSSSPSDRYAGQSARLRGSHGLRCSALVSLLVSPTTIEACSASRWPWRLADATTRPEMKSFAFAQNVRAHHRSACRRTTGQRRQPICESTLPTLGLVVRCIAARIIPLTSALFPNVCVCLCLLCACWDNTLGWGVEGGCVPLGAPLATISPLPRC